MIKSGTHLVVIDDSSCETTNAEQLSDPVILNYYRQVFVKADRTFDFQQEGLKRKIYEAVSRCGINLYKSYYIIKIFDLNNWNNLPSDLKKRVYSGVSAILNFEIVNYRPFPCSDGSIDNECRIIELFLTVDTINKMQNGVNIDESIDR